MGILCKVIGHKIKHGTVNTHRMTALCAWCYKKLKVSYDMSYGHTVVEGDFGDQRTFCWCHCGNELVSTNSFLDEYNFKTKDNNIELIFGVAKCSKCGHKSKWDFDKPAPLLIESDYNK